MSETLRDPTKNPWYVLATIFGEQDEDGVAVRLGASISARNRRAWNGWYCGGLSDEERSRLAKEVGVKPVDFRPLSEEELGEITTLFQARMGGDATLPNLGEIIDFSNTHFTQAKSWERFVFTHDVSFEGSTFDKGTLFSNASFQKRAVFFLAVFIEHVDFQSCIFEDFADFGYANFGNGGNFMFVKFGSTANFSNSKFKGGVAFSNAMFEKTAWFTAAIFSSGASFERSTFCETAEFVSAVFAGRIDFQSAKFRATTRFQGAEFKKEVPEFWGADLYDETVFILPDNHLENWPPLPSLREYRKTEKWRDKTETHKRDYNRLRLFMSKSLQIEEEQFFHRMEMRCKMELANRCESRWCNLINMYWWYSVVSDFGNSVKRPVCGLLGLIVLGWPLMIYHLLDSSGIISSKVFFEAGGWSIANSLPFLGFGKLYYGAKFAGELTTFLKVIGGFQTLMGFVLLFFLGLGLRNRFRLR